MTDRSVLVRLRADVSDFVAKSQLAKAAVRDLNNEIDKSNDRTAWLAQGILALTPAVTALGAGAVPVLSGMATQMMLTVAAAGTMALAFNGVGDALGALNDYQLEPTDENLKQLNEAMAKIGPTGQAFVEFLDSLGPVFSELSNTAREGLFPGLTSGIEDFMTLAPQLNEVISEISSGLGQLGAEAGANLAGPRFEEFFDYLETRAKPILVEMGRTLGNFADGFLNMIVAFDPLTAGFSSGLLEMSRSFVTWSEGLSNSTGFQEFVDYVREAGPQALDFLGSFIMMFVELAEAAAPIGAVMLPLLTALADVIGDLANTPLGPLTIGFLAFTSALGRLQALAAITGSGVLSKLTTGLRGNAKAAKAAVPTFREFGSAAAFAMTSTDALAKSSMSYSQKANQSAVSALRARGAVQEFGRSVAPVVGQTALLAVAMSDVDDKMGLTNTTTLTLAGSLGGKWGAAAGATIGLFMDMKAGADEATKGFEGLDAAAASGNAEALMARIAEAKKELADQQDVTGVGDFFSDALRDVGASGNESALAVYTKAIDDAEAELANLKNAQQDVASDKTLYNSLMAETRAIESNIAAMREKRAEAIRGLNAELDYKSSILDARDALKENGKSVNENTRAGQANLGALYAMASAFNAQGDAAKDSAGEVRAGRKQFVDMAVAMGMGEDAARKLAKRLYELPANVPIKIGVDHETAMAHARAVKAQLDSIDRFIPVNIHVSRTGQGGDIPYVSGGTPKRSADGSTVPDAPGPYRDQFLYKLAQREEIISNRYGQADKNRAALKAANAGAKIAVVGYADGGTAGTKGDKPKRRARNFSVNDNTAALEQALVILTAAAEDQTAAVEANRTALENSSAAVEFWSGRMAEAGQNTLSNFGLDLFAKDSSPWAAGAGGGALSNLSKTNTGLENRISLQQQLKDAGLSGDALTELLKGTNQDIQGMISRGEIGQYAASYAQYQTLSSTASTQAGQAAYGAEYGAAQAVQAQAAAALQAQLAEQQKSTQAVARMESQIRTMATQIEQFNSDAPERIGARVGSEINGAAATGHRESQWRNKR